MKKQETVRNCLLKELSQMNPNDRVSSRVDLCRKYGFSRTTIDLALNGLIEEGYLYTKHGSGTYMAQKAFDLLVAKKKQEERVSNWGVIVPNMARDVYPFFLLGIEDYCRGKNINLIVCNTKHDPVEQNRYAFRMIDSGADGVILFPANTTNIDVSGPCAILDAKIPLVLCYRYIEMADDIPFVSTNDFYGGYIATKHLISHGYRKIVFASFKRYKTTMDRYLGYAAALIENNISIDRDLVLSDLESSESPNAGEALYKAARELIRRRDDVDAFFCYNDRAAVRIVSAIRDEGKRISDDIGVIGYDNSALCTAGEVHLSSVDFKSYDVGYKCAEILDNEIKGIFQKGCRTYVFQPDVVARDSCLGKKELVAQAL